MRSRARAARSIWGYAVLGWFCTGCGSSRPDQPASEAVRATVEPISATCPNGNGLFVLYYGDAPISSEMPALRAARPNFVVAANGDPAAPDHFHFDNPAARTGPTGIKVLAYIPMNYRKENECAGNSTRNTTCTNLSCSGCDCVPIQQRISNAIAAGYDGVFFDEAEHESPAASYNSACYSAVKQGNPNRLVILNPGVAAPNPGIFDAADIVSVENQYIANVAAYGKESWRWLAVQGDPGSPPHDAHELPPQSAEEAMTRLGDFRENGGFWYYSAEPHWALEPWFSAFATSAKAAGDVPCPASYSVTVNALALDNGNAEIHPGMCVFVDNDTSACAGFTPYTATLTAGTHTLTVTDFPPNDFQYWDNGSTVKARVVNVTGNATYNAYYTTQ
jgi:hypothetical protein